jgi:hypothetical protein
MKTRSNNKKINKRTNKRTGRTGIKTSRRRTTKQVRVQKGGVIDDVLLCDALRIIHEYNYLKRIFKELLEAPVFKSIHTDARFSDSLHAFFQYNILCKSLKKVLTNLINLFPETEKAKFTGTLDAEESMGPDDVHQECIKINQELMKNAGRAKAIADFKNMYGIYNLPSIIKQLQDYIKYTTIPYLREYSKLAQNTNQQLTQEDIELIKNIFDKMAADEELTTTEKDIIAVLASIGIDEETIYYINYIDEIFSQIALAPLKNSNKIASKLAGLLQSYNREQCDSQSAKRNKSNAWADCSHRSNGSTSSDDLTVEEL